MSGYSKRSVREAEKREERLHFLFIAKYIEGLHRNVYNQAEEFYQTVKYKNPGVKDLTKTAEFIETVTPNATIPRHYTSKRREHLIRRDPPQQGNNMSRMVLNIPLMEVPPQTTTVQPLPPSLPQDDVSSPSHPETSTVQPLPPSLPQDDVSSPLHPDVYKTLLEGLRSDPDLWNIFNDFQDDPDGMDGLVAGDMGDSFTIDDMSELELAVEAIF